ncbi:MAG: siderophore-interacting protein [Thalassobaculaceae bacterium]|nr:siderophore-interacting protein [Thalassobaculaceae bacterium]
MADLKAEATIPFSNVAAYLPAILESIATHNLVIRPDGEGHVVTSSFGATARLLSSQSELRLDVEAQDPAAFNHLKHDLTSLIDFVARGERLKIDWTGDMTGAALPPNLRILRVRNVHDLTPRMRRVTFHGADLERFSVSDQLHCRLLFQDRSATAPKWPQLGDNGRIVWPDASKLDTRIYTIRRVDPPAGTLDVDFFMHGGDGPGMQWASGTAPGDIVGIVGPAAHGPKQADWNLLVGDETGLPGIARILEGLPRSARGVALIEVAGAAEEQAIDAPPGVEVRWLHRGSTAPGTTRLLADSLRTLALPPAPATLFVWVGAEYAAFRETRGYLRNDLGVPASRMVAFSHWRRGMSEEDIATAGVEAISG